MVMPDKNEKYHWQQHPAVEQLLLQLLGGCRKNNPDIAILESKMQTATSTRLLDWVDHFITQNSQQWRKELEALGFNEVQDLATCSYRHPGAQLPVVMLVDKAAQHPTGVAIKVESIADFLQINGFSTDIEGSPLAPFRRSCASVHNDSALYIVERRGTRTLQPVPPPDGHQENYLRCQELWQNIPRHLDDQEQAFAAILNTAEALIAKVGKDTAAHIVCHGERNYWMSRNYAGRIQKMRQDNLGLGWCNHDHHTFRSSRQHFTKLVALFSLLGFDKRERFYAGKEAGWGAQVMENATAGLSLFLDVDLSPEEVAVDFSRQELIQRDELGTVGLWCALHGDSILNAGMHHIGANSLFDALSQDLQPYAIEFMAPFSNFEYLKQSFSKGEIWPVAPKKIQALLEQKVITTKKADQFINQGAIGSHLENIQRRDGYKGFNKNNVNIIIRGTDPRTYI